MVEADYKMFKLKRLLTDSCFNQFLQLNLVKTFRKRWRAKFRVVYCWWIVLREEERNIYDYLLFQLAKSVFEVNLFEKKCLFFSLYIRYSHSRACENLIEVKY